MTERINQLEIENHILKQLLLEKNSVIVNEVKSRLFLTVYKEWLENKKGDIQTSTYYEYERIYNTYIIPYWEKQCLDITQVTPEHIHAYYKFLKNQYGMSNTTLIRHHANLFTCFKYAYEKNYIQSLVIDKVKRPQPDTVQLVNYYDINELVELLVAVRKTNLYMPVTLAALLGLRRSELLALKWDAFNFKNSTITIKRKMTRDKNRSVDVVSRNLKNPSSNRTLIVPDFLLKDLGQHRIKCSKTAICKDFLEFVCIDDNGQLPTLNMITNRFRAFINSGGYRKIRFHDLRHSCASMLLTLGYSMKDIQEWLGHSNYATTANIYAHVDLDEKKRIAEKLNEVFKG